MTREIMRRKASDNVYLHKDFHGALSNGIQFIHEKYGADAVRTYLRQFVAAYYAPLKAEIKKRGLPALKDYFKKMYRLEGGVIHLTCSDDELRLEVEACPAVTHMRRYGYPVAELFYETTKTVNEALCENTPFSAELVRYDEADGHSSQRFYRRVPSAGGGLRYERNLAKRGCHSHENGNPDSPAKLGQAEKIRTGFPPSRE